MHQLTHKLTEHGGNYKWEIFVELLLKFINTIFLYQFYDK